MLFYCICYVKDQTDGDKNEKGMAFFPKLLIRRFKLLVEEQIQFSKFNLSQHFCTVKEMVFIVTLKMIMLKRHYLTFMQDWPCKFWALWITSWNQDCWEKYPQPQICRWYHSNVRKWRGAWWGWTKRVKKLTWHSTLEEHWPWQLVPSVHGK